jgi:hypothetical protein
MGIPPLVVAAFCILTKELLFRITRAVGQRTRQPVLFAAAKHHRSDAMSSLAAAVGAGGVLVGLPIADTIVRSASRRRSPSSPALLAAVMISRSTVAAASVPAAT